MAKIGLFTFPAMGHVNPMNALGRRLQGLGHTVVFIQLLDLKEPILAAGLDFIPLGSKECPPGTLKQRDSKLATMTGSQALKYLVEASIDTCYMILSNLPRDASGRWFRSAPCGRVSFSRTYCRRISRDSRDDRRSATPSF